MFIGLYSSSSSVAVPLGPILSSVLYILILPLIFGQLLRYYLVKKKGSVMTNMISKGYLSLATMLSMLALIFVLVDREAPVMISKPVLVGYLMGYQTIIILGIMALSVIVSRLMQGTLFSSLF